MKVKSKNRMQPDEAMKILKQEGIEVTREQAQLILDFLYKFAKISLATLVENPKNECHRQFDSYRAIMEEMAFKLIEKTSLRPKPLLSLLFRGNQLFQLEQTK